MILTLSEISALKAALAEQGIIIHFHNTCGSQYFTLDETGDAVVAAVEACFAVWPASRLVFDPNRLGFYVLDR